MACQELSVSLEQVSIPQAEDCFCRVYDFSEPPVDGLQTFVTNNPMITSAGERMVIFS